MSKNKLSVYISYLLRHRPEDLSLSMDAHGWVSVEELIQRINDGGKYRLTREALDEIVRTDNKGRFRYSADGTRIKACQGHSIPWVEPELRYGAPPSVLYHGTTRDAWEKIMHSGQISKMNRHAVHMQADVEKAWQSARRWRRVPVVLKIDAGRMHASGMVFGVSDNGVWCTESVPTDFILAVLEEP